MRSHGIIIDENGIAWFNADGGLGKINTRTEQLEYFKPPRGMAGVGRNSGRKPGRHHLGIEHRGGSGL